MLTSLSPQIKIDDLATSYGQIYAIRDDLLQGGTKQRAVIPFLKDRRARGYREFVYASPFSGFAQVALAAACAQLKYPCTIFCEQDNSKDAPSHSMHEFSKLAESLGANVRLVSSFQEADARARIYCYENTDRLEIPLGFDCQEYKDCLRAALASQLQYIITELGGLPAAFWLPVGSGTLGNVFRDLLPETVLLNCVNVRVLAETDSRLQQLAKRPNVFMYRAPEIFSESVHHLPPIPSNAFYDAKLWQFICRKGMNGDVWWNVAR